MANRTVKGASTVKGTNPQFLIEKIIRSRIYECRYWKEECFALTAELLVDKALELKYIGGTTAAHIKPTPFLCLVCKMLQIQPEKDIVIEFIKQDEFKYVRCLGAMYLRLTGNSLEVYEYLEPLLSDFRRIKKMTKMGAFEISHIDEFIDLLLNEDRVCEIILPRLQKRSVLEENGQLKPRWSALEEDLEAIVAEEEANKISAQLNTADGYESPIPSPPRKEKKRKDKKDKKDKKEKKKKKYKDLDAPDSSRRSRSPDRPRDRDRRSRSRDRRSPDRRKRHYSSD